MADAEDLAADFQLLHVPESGPSDLLAAAVAGAGYAAVAAAGVAPAALTTDNLTHHDRQLKATASALTTIERRQFVCPKHGPFWKQVVAAKPVARCKSCNREEAEADPKSQGGPKYTAIPKEEERGRGLFRCPSCGHTWTSNTACRGLQQYCQNENCDAAEREIGAFPAEIREPLPPRPYFRKRRPMDAVPENGVSEGGGGDFGGGGGGGDFGGGGGFGDGGGGGGFGDGFGGGGGGGGGRIGQRRPHWCSGCATGACKRKPPESTIHESTGSTAPTLSVKTWTTNGSVAWSEGSSQSRRSRGGRGSGTTGADSLARVSGSRSGDSPARSSGSSYVMVE